MKSAKVIRVKRGSAVVNVYPTPTGKHQAWTVSYHFAGKRSRAKRSCKTRALELAAEIASSLATAEKAKLHVSDSDACSLSRAKELLAPLGKPIELVAAEYVSAAALLGPKVSLIDAVRFYRKMNPDDQRAISVPDLVTELLSTKAKDGVSDLYMRDLRGRLGRFAEAFQCPTSSLQGREMEDWIRSLGLGQRSRNNFRAVLAVLVNFAVSRGYLPKGWDGMAGVTKAKLQAGRVPIFSPAELRQLLSLAPDALVPYIALAAFAGIRAQEICRLNWSDVNWEAGHVTLQRAVTKTGRQRHAPIPTNLRAWLEPWRGAHGAICSYRHVANHLLGLARHAGLPWQRNGLRHSFISYRVAQTRNEAQVAMEAGNTVSIIHSNYLELVSDQAAREWFDIGPAHRDQKVLKLFEA